MRTPNPRHSATQPDTADFKRTLPLAVLLPLVLTAIPASLFLWQISRLFSAAQWVEHTDEVIARANSAQRPLVDAETGVRDYFLTGRQEFLEPYNRATPQIAPALNARDQLLSDNPAQGQRLDVIRAEREQWERYARDVIALKEGVGDYLTLVKRGDGKRRMDAMRAEFSSFIATEESLRDEQPQAYRVLSERGIGTD